MTQLVRYEAACRALAECKAVDEVKSWADRAAAMQAYGRMAKDKTLEVDAAEIRLRAERRLGELITAQKAGPGLATGSRGQLAGRESGGLAVVANDRQKDSPTLAAAGISKDLSSRAQKLAAVPESEFEAEVGQWRERVSAEGARVSARLEAAGERALKNQPPAPDAAPPEMDQLREQLAEMAENLRAAVEDNESMARVFEANDQVAAATTENKQLRALNRVLDSRVEGLMNEKNEAISAAKSWQRKFEKAERALKDGAAGVTANADPDLADQLSEAQHTIADLAQEIEQLCDRIAVESMDGTEEAKTQAAETIRELRARVETAEAELDAVKVSRDTYMRQGAEMENQIRYWRRRAENAEGAAA